MRYHIRLRAQLCCTCKCPDLIGKAGGQCIFFLYLFYRLFLAQSGRESAINYHGAQFCELVGLFLLEELSQIPGLGAILYRDDGLGVTRATVRHT